MPILGFFSRRLTPTEHALADIAQGVRSFNASFNARMERMEQQMATNQEILDRLVAEGAETTAKVDLLLASNEAARADIATFGDRLKQAVADAIANNPGLDLAAAAKVADDLDALQARMETARQALDAAVEADKPATVPPTPTAGEGA